MRGLLLNCRAQRHFRSTRGKMKPKPQLQPLMRHVHFSKWPASEQLTNGPRALEQCQWMRLSTLNSEAADVYEWMEATWAQSIGRERIIKISSVHSKQEWWRLLRCAVCGIVSTAELTLFLFFFWVWELVASIPAKWMTINRGKWFHCALSSFPSKCNRFLLNIHFFFRTDQMATQPPSESLFIATRFNTQVSEAFVTQSASCVPNKGSNNLRAPQPFCTCRANGRPLWMESASRWLLNDRQSEWTNHRRRLSQRTDGDVWRTWSVESPPNAISEISWLRFVSGRPVNSLATTRRWQSTLTRTWQKGMAYTRFTLSYKLPSSEQTGTLVLLRTRNVQSENLADNQRLRSFGNFCPWHGARKRGNSATKKSPVSGSLANLRPQVKLLTLLTHANEILQVKCVSGTLKVKWIKVTFKAKSAG